MSFFFEIHGGHPLKGEVQISGAKNAALPMMMASLMSSTECKFSNVPDLEDIKLTIKLLEHFGAHVTRDNSVITVRTEKLLTSDASYSLVKSLRASFWVLGPVLARKGEANVALPGGDIIGTRPVDIHLSALSQMGAEISLSHGVVTAKAPSGLKPAEIDFSFPSVGATHQILMAAALTEGTTVIRGAAREPEVEALASMLRDMGAEIEGDGTATVVIRGKRELNGADVHLIGDRIEAGTFLIAGLLTDGAVRVVGIKPSYFGEFLSILSDMGCIVECGENWVSARRGDKLHPTHIVTRPFPGFATDLQSLIMPFLSVVSGESSIEESVFESRFAHVSELIRMGAKIDLIDRTAKVHGGTAFSAAPVEGHDIRGAACMVLAALAADGISQIFEAHHIRRGYEKFEEKIRKISGKIYAKTVFHEDAGFLGC